MWTALVSTLRIILKYVDPICCVREDNAIIPNTETWQETQPSWFYFLLKIFDERQRQQLLQVTELWCTQQTGRCVIIFRLAESFVFFKQYLRSDQFEEAYL